MKKEQILKYLFIYKKANQSSLYMTLCLGYLIKANMPIERGRVIRIIAPKQKLQFSNYNYCK